MHLFLDILIIFINTSQKTFFCQEIKLVLLLVVYDVATLCINTEFNCKIALFHNGFEYRLAFRF